MILVRKPNFRGACLKKLRLSSLVGVVFAVSGDRATCAAELFEFAPYVVETTRLETDWMDVAQALTVVGRQQIQRANQQITLDESLQGTPGVFILNPDNYAQDTRIAIRGFGARADFGIRGIKLIIDGIPATTPDGQGEVDGMDLGSAGRIEVLRGPGAAYYGAASGGVIRISSEAGAADPFLETRISLGSYGQQHWQLKTGGQSGALDYLLSAGHLTSDGYRGNSETENTRLNGILRYRLDDRQQIRLVFNLIDFPLQNDAGGLTRAEALADPRQARSRNLQYDSGESVAQERFGLSYELQLDPAHALEFSAFHTHRDFNNRLPFEDGGQVELDRRYGGGRAGYTYSGGNSRVRLGLDIDRQDDDRRNYDNLDGMRGSLAVDQREQVRSAGLFVVFENRIRDNLLLSSAVRYDDIRFTVTDALLDDGDDSGSVSISEVNPTIGLNWSVSDSMALYVNAARSFETPTTTEFDNPGGGGFNPDLRSQTARSLEMGSKGWFQLATTRIAYDIAIFHLEIEDALVSYELPQFPGREFYRNAGESTRRGVEAAVEVTLGGGFRMTLDYTWSDFTYDRFTAGTIDYSGKLLPGIPRHFGSIALHYESDSGLFATWRSRYVGDLYANDSNAEEVSSYAVTNLSVGYRWESGKWTVEPYFAISNLFNESYFANIRINAFGGRYFEPAAERNYHAGVRARYGF